MVVLLTRVGPVRTTQDRHGFRIKRAGHNQRKKWRLSRAIYAHDSRSAWFPYGPGVIIYHVVGQSHYLRLCSAVLTVVATLCTMAAGALDALRAQSFFAQCPEAVGVITDEGVLVASNARFERTVGPASKLEGRDFLVNAVSAEEHERFKIAMHRARAACSPSADAPDGRASDLVEWASTPTVRTCATMALGNAGDFPIWRKMDWTLTVFDDTR
jgi:hypothetical protein